MPFTTTGTTTGPSTLPAWLSACPQVDAAALATLETRLRAINKMAEFKRTERSKVREDHHGVHTRTWCYCMLYHF
jgi:hypothetical protein